MTGKEPQALGRRWLYAAKPGSWPKLLVPMVLGQAMGIAALGGIRPASVAFGALFTLLDLLFIVFLNDYFDRRVDRLKREMFPDGCSPKTIPDAILPAKALLIAGLAAGAAALGLAAWAEVVLQRPHLFWGALGALGIFVAYSLPPLRLNYRGGGEWLEMLGVGLLLPLYNAYAVADLNVTVCLAVLPGFCALSLASALASGLSDEESDRLGGKHTVASDSGNATVRRRCEDLMLLGALLWAMSARVCAEVIPLPFAFAGVVIVIVNWHRMRKCSSSATTNAFAAQGRYKALLHHAVWRGAAVLALGIALGAVAR